MAHATAAAITHEEIHALRLVITHVKIPVKIIKWKSIRARKIYFDWNCIKRGRKCGFVFVSPITWSVLRGTGIRFIDMNTFHLNYATIFESDINILTLFHLVDLTFEDWNARSRRLFQGKTLAPRMETYRYSRGDYPYFSVLVAESVAHTFVARKKTKFDIRWKCWKHSLAYCSQRR